jgi:hypothetical protein
MASDFKLQAMRFIARLYDDKPHAVNLSADAALLSEAPETTPDAEARLCAAVGTLSWLYRNGLVTGIFKHGTHPLIGEAQLSPSCLRVLDSAESDIFIQPFGDAVSKAVKSPGTAVEALVADLLMSRLVRTLVYPGLQA